MDFDLILVIGLIITILAIPAMFSAAVDGRPPRGAAIMILLGGGLVVIALSQHPAGYQIAELPEVVMRVIGRYLF